MFDSPLLTFVLYGLMLYIYIYGRFIYLLVRLLVSSTILIAEYVRVDGCHAWSRNCLLVA